MIAHVDTALTDNSSALLASYTRTPLADWLYSREDINSIFQYTELLLHRPTDQLIELLEHTRTAIIVLKISQLPQLNVLVNRLLELFPNGCSLTLIVVNERDRMFKHHLAAALNSCNGPRFENIKLHFNTGPLRATLDAHFQRAMHLFFGGQKSWTKHAYGLGMLTVLGGLYATSNLIGLTDKKGRKFKATSAIVSVNIKPVFAHMPNTVKKLEACM